MRHLNKIIFCLLAVFFLASCGKEDTDKNQQESYIASIASAYQESDSTVTVRHAKGSTIVTITQGTGEELTTSGTVSFLYAGYYITSASISNSNLFSTNNSDIAETAGWTLSDTTVFKADTLKISDADLVEGLKNGIIGVKSGEECLIMFNQDYGFGKKIIGNIPENSALAYHLWIESVAN
jgi:FKBP-type peptidyl-prolyl cis-trans isomerase